MSEHNFIRGNTIETMKLLKTMRARDNSSHLEVKESTSPFNRKQAASLMQPTVSTFESKSQMLSDNSNNKSHNLEDNITDNSMSFLNNHNNMSSLMLDEEKGSILDDSTLIMNNEKQVENLFTHQTYPQNSIATPNRYQNKKCIQLSQQHSDNNQNKSHSGLLNVFEQDNLEGSQFLYKIKHKRATKRHQEEHKGKSIKSKEQEQDTQENQTQEQRCSSPFLQNALNNGVSSNSNSKNSGSSSGSSNLLSVCDFQYMLESNFKNVKKRLSNEQEQLLNQNSSLLNNSNTINSVNNSDWKQKLITTIKEKVNRSQQTNIFRDPLPKVQQSTLTPIRIIDIKSKTEANSKRNSKEEQLTNSFNLQFSHKETIDKSTILHTEGCATINRISFEKPTLMETIQNNQNEIKPHQGRRQPTNVFSEKLNFLDVLKKFSENFKKVEMRSQSSQPCKKNNFVMENNYSTNVKYNIHNIIKNNHQSSSVSPLKCEKTPKNHNQCEQHAPQNQKQFESILNSTLEPKEMQLTRGTFNSSLYYTRLSSVRKNKSREHSRRAYDQKQTEQMQKTQMQEQLKQDYLNNILPYNQNQTIDNDYDFDNLSEKLITKNSIQFKRSIKKILNEEKGKEQKANNQSTINSIEFEPVQQPPSNYSFVQKQLKINKFYTDFYQRKKNITPLKNACITPTKQTNNNVNNISPIKTDSRTPIIQTNNLPPFNKCENKKQIPYSFVTPKIFKCNEQQQNIFQQQKNSNLLQIKENDLLPWEYSKRNSQINDIDVYMYNMNKTGLIQG